MGRKRFPEQLVGIRLLPDSYIPHCFNTNQLNNGNIIGTIYIAIEGKTCAHLRQAINTNLEAPKDFCFLNSSGWPLGRSIENKIYISECLTSNVVTILKKYGKLSRIGIKLLNGQILGFIFLSFNSEIPDIRQLIISELGDQFQSNETFEFLENNLWPVKKIQESSLTAWDLVVNNCITIVKKTLKRTVKFENDKLEKKKLKLFEKPSSEILNREEFNLHSILISYVHQEAGKYARDLKNELLRMGFKKIFLDIDDISAGQDWQDVISLAVNNCSIFVPLVTPRYGETRWTNREAKLADDREKTIIPVSFLDKWPPDQLAIQFVTLQYIPWKTTDEVNGGSFSGDSDSLWNQKSVQRVANEIKKLCPETEVTTPDSVSLLDDNLDSSQKLLCKSSEKQKYQSKENFIVISAHSKEKDFVNEITTMLERNGFRVWSSMNMCDCDESTFSPLEDTQPLINSPLIENNGHSLPMLNFINDKSNAIVHSSSSVQWLKREFKGKVKEAKLVVLIFSEEYLKSRICRQQLYYCEQRKKAIVIKHGDFQLDSFILNLYPEHEMIAKENWECLKFKIKEKLKFDTEDSYRRTIMLSVSKLRNVVDTSLTVYVIGGTDKISSSAEKFCLVLGNELGKVKQLNLATEGFFGVGEIVGKNFCEEQEIRYKGQPPKVYHIIPFNDTSDYSHKARQQLEDGSFQKLPYGNTLYYGMSVSNRDDIVACAFKLCILIEGGERSACLAEKFLWNDCSVIPVLFNNSAVEHKQCLKESITRVPEGVSLSDWKNLNTDYCSPEERAMSVKRIVCALLNLDAK